MPTFREVVADAITDIVENGFDSLERIERWKRAIAEAARRSMISEATLEDELRTTLATIYRKMVERDGVVKFNPGIDRFTLERIKPTLRPELDRRIVASANLIKLNREEAIAKTLRRFEGWSTSIPPGGVSAEKKPEVKKSVGKSLASLPFEERRVLIDQGHKLTAAISEIVASDGGAIAGRWRSHYRQAGYNYRPDHKDRDDQIYLIRDSWAHQAGLVKPGRPGYYDDVTAVGQEINCRCYMVWLYALRDLPAEMLTAKGRAALAGARGREEVRSARTARGDASLLRARGVEAIPAPVLQEVVEADALNFMEGLKRIKVIRDVDQWHGETDKGVVTLEAKFANLPPADQALVLAHEVGHLGQELFPVLFAEFRRRHEDRMEFFLDMANEQHLADYVRNGHIDGGKVSEVFAESYARFILARPLPRELADFWREKVTGLMSQRTAAYSPWWGVRTSRCQRCSMFVPGLSPVHNRCTAVEGDIAIHGHCKLFAIKGARTDAAGQDDPRPGVGYEAMRRRLERLKEETAR